MNFRTWRSTLYTYHIVLVTSIMSEFSDIPVREIFFQYIFTLFFYRKHSAEPDLHWILATIVSMKNKNHALCMCPLRFVKKLWRKRPASWCRCRVFNKVDDEERGSDDTDTPEARYIYREWKKPPLGDYPDKDFTLGEYTEKVIQYGFLMVGIYSPTDVWNIFITSTKTVKIWDFFISCYMSK